MSTFIISHVFDVVFDEAKHRNERTELDKKRKESTIDVLNYSKPKKTYSQMSAQSQASIRLNNSSSPSRNLDTCGYNDSVNNTMSAFQDQTNNEEYYDRIHTAENQQELYSDARLLINAATGYDVTHDQTIHQPNQVTPKKTNEDSERGDQEQRLFSLSQDEQNGDIDENYDHFQNKKYTTVTVDGYGDKRDSESIVSSDTLSSKLENYTKEQLFRYICKIRAKKDNSDVEPVNKITLHEVIKCSKYELFKKIQFIRHHNVLEEYTKKGSIGRFVMKTLKIKSSRRQVFWNTYSHHVRRAIKSQRNVVHTNLRRKFMGKVISFDHFDSHTFTYTYCFAKQIFIFFNFVVRYYEKCPVKQRQDKK